jgi:hypothetical protein
MFRRSTALALSAVLCLSACSSGFEPMPLPDAGTPRTATVVVTSPTAPVRRQIAYRGARLAEPDYDAFQAGLVRSSATVLGATAGHYAGWYAATASSGTTVGAASAALPVVGIALAGATAAGGAVIKRDRYARAEAAVDPHEDALADVDVGARLRTHLAARVGELDGLAVTGVVDADALLADTALDEDEELARVLGEADTDLVVVVAPVPMLSPRFEILEIQTLVSVFDRAAERPDRAVYANTLVVQSAHHGGRHGDGTREHMDALVAEYRAREIDAARRHGDGEFDDYEQARLAERIAHNSRWFTRRYDPIDLHDPEGGLWLEDDGAPLRDALDAGLASVAGLVVADLDGTCTDGTGERRRLPGTELPMRACDEMAARDRAVYRGEGGILFEIDADSRFLLAAPL